MDRLTLFGLFAVTAMLVTYALEKRSPWFILAFAFPACVGRPTASCKGHGLSGWWKPLGRCRSFAVDTIAPAIAV
jgi:hypothetical protein